MPSASRGNWQKKKNEIYSPRAQRLPNAGGPPLQIKLCCRCLWRVSNGVQIEFSKLRAARAEKIASDPPLDGNGQHAHVLPTHQRHLLQFIRNTPSVCHRETIFHIKRTLTAGPLNARRELDATSVALLMLKQKFSPPGKRRGMPGGDGVFICNAPANISFPSPFHLISLD